MRLRDIKQALPPSGSGTDVALAEQLLIAMGQAKVLRALATSSRAELTAGELSYYVLSSPSYTPRIRAAIFSGLLSEARIEVRREPCPQARSGLRSIYRLAPRQEGGEP